MSRQTSPATLRAIERVRKGGESRHAAALAEGLHPSTVYRAMAKMRDKR